MLFHSRRNEHLTKLEDRLVVADKVTRELMSDVIALACRRVRTLGTLASVRLDWLIDANAWTDAALTLVEFELPQWHPRRLVRDESEWLCTLSRQPAVPLEFDQTAEGRHQLLPLAILLALLQAKRASGTAAAGMNPASQDAASDAAPDAVANLTASRTSPSQPFRQELAVAAWVFVLAALVLICAGMFVPPFWTAVVGSWQFRPSVQECSLLKSATDRGGCYEDRNVRSAHHPAKGANAPAIFRLSGRHGE
jgi:hypothetical protein